ncbi:MAG TPA: primosome assembly protein PriA [Dermatophilaceae bacterium]|nr:primosome assembly protein PriA [Dermatophilaceae bacterium]
MSGQAADARSGAQDVPGEQLALLRPVVPRARRPAPAGRAPTRPVASVLVDSGLPHLDRPFEYVVPEALDVPAQPGVRVRVRFAGKDRDGFVVSRLDAAEHQGRLAPLRRVVSPEPVLTPHVLEAARRVARRCGGPVGDVLRLAVPPRHAAAERALPLDPPAPPGPQPGSVAAQTAASETPPTRTAAAEPAAAKPPAEPAAWQPYAAGRPFLARLAAGEAPAASLLAVPSTDPARDWPALLASAARVAADAGRGAVLVVPDARDVARVEAALLEHLGPGRHTRLTADQGPQARYTAYLKVLRGHVRVVVGTRAAAFAPVRDLGLVTWWDDGDDLLEEPRSPHPHVRDVLRARAAVEGAALLSAGFSRSVAVAALVADGSLRPVAAEPRAVRAAAPRVHVAGEGPDLARDSAAERARLPSVAHRAAREALEHGPVLVSVPRRGYVPALACAGCRRPARCAGCGGPLALTGPQGPAACRLCGRAATPFTCPSCEGDRLRSTVVGSRRTAEELGRAFAGVPLATSGSGVVLDRVDREPRLVIATPGAEPVADGGYAACLLLDAWALLDRADLRAGEEALRRWLAASALVRAGADGGRVVLCGAPTHTTVPAVEALVRWDPGWFADRELAERAELGLPPAVRMATLTGRGARLAVVLGEMRLPPSARVLGPLLVGGGPAPDRILVTVPPADGDLLAAEVAAVRARTSARKEPEPVTVRMDPPDPAA